MGARRGRGHWLLEQREAILALSALREAPPPKTVTFLGPAPKPPGPRGRPQGSWRRVDTTRPRVCGVWSLKPSPRHSADCGRWRTRPGWPPDSPASSWGPLSWDLEVRLGATLGFQVSAQPLVAV